MTPDVAQALLVDLYELTMVDAYRREKMAHRPATFSLFVRALPAQRSYLVAAGLEDALAWLEQLHFGPEELSVIERLGLFSPEFLDWLSTLHFAGVVRAVPEGTVVSAEEPILEVDGPVAQCVKETAVDARRLDYETTMLREATRAVKLSPGVNRRRSRRWRPRV
jgi:nicotinate phosphoribosyltransferase